MTGTVASSADAGASYEEALLEEATAIATPASAEPAWASPSVAWKTMILIALFTVFGQFDRAVFYLLVSPIKKDLLLSDTQMSVLMGAAYSSAYFICGLPIARWIDVGPRKFIAAGALAAWSLGTAFCAMSANFTQLYCARMVVGGGEAVKGPSAVSMISDLFPRDKAPRAFAVYNWAIQGGDALANIIGGGLILFFTAMGAITVPLLGTLHTWHLVFLTFGVPGVLFALVFATFAHEPARHGRKIKGSVPLREVVHFLFRSPSGKVLVPILLASAILQIEAVGIGSWRMPFYERTYGLTAGQVAPIVGIGNFILTPIGLIFGAWLNERMTKSGRYDANMRISLWSHMIGLPLGLAGPLMPSFELAIGCSFLGFLITIAAAPAQLAAMQVVTPNELRAQVNALYMVTVGVFGSGIGPSVIALMTDYLFKSEHDLRYAMVTAVAVAAPIALLLIWRTLKPYGELYRAQMAQE
ncbi:MFS transporter [Sphingobium nicotianae]|uniref:MFS transporter n=1 Tax=Sphingobium nicotianae TaxID=2782607 RepID=A0A9X1DD19_9SPHN|nr:MFS transporter [Sphingobium nicotianae]MBT2187811.1 MFS transporter [Sphingobium nicotianae]